MRILPIALAGAVVGCGGPPPPPDDDDVAPAPTEARAEDETAIPPVVALDRKLDAYAQCLHRSRGPIARAWSRWEPRVDAEGRPRKKADPPRLDPIDAELAPCRQAVDRVRAQDPVLPELDELIVRYHDAARAFADVSLELSPYYAEEKYADDDWALGRQRQSALRTAHDDLAVVTSELAGALATAQADADAKMAAHIEAQHGKTPVWHAYVAYAAARDLAGCIAASDPPSASACTAEREASASATATFEAALARPEAPSAFWLDAFAASLRRVAAEATPPPGAKGKKAPAPDPALVAGAFDDLDRDFRQIEVDFPGGPDPD